MFLDHEKERRGNKEERERERVEKKREKERKEKNLMSLFNVTGPVITRRLAGTG